MAKLCAICDVHTVFITRRKIASDEVVCTNCFNKARTLTTKQIIKLKTVSADEIRQSIFDSIGEEVINFVPSKIIGTAIHFDDKNKKILIPSLFGRGDVIDYSQIISYELLEDDEMVTSGGLGRAAVGGLLFGGAGAVVGAITAKKNKGLCNSMKIKLTIDNIDLPAVYITFISEKTKTDSETYRVAASEAQECLSVLQLICNRNE